MKKRIILTGALVAGLFFGGQANALDITKLGTAGEQFYKRAKTFPYKLIKADLLALKANVDLLKQTQDVTIKIEAMLHITQILTRIIQKLTQMLEPANTFVGVFSKSLEKQGKELRTQVDVMLKSIGEINKEIMTAIEKIKKTTGALPPTQPIPAV